MSAAVSVLPSPLILAAPPCAKCGKVHQKCKAHRNKRDAEGNMIPCNGTPVKDGPGTCRMHGGHPLKGEANPAYRHGRKSKYAAHLPRQLADSYVKVTDDEQLLSLRDDVELQTNLVIELLRKMDQNPPVPWDQIEHAVNELFKVLQDKKSQRTARDGAMRDVLVLCEKGAAADRAQAGLRGELRELLQEKTKTAAAEHKRRVDLQTLLNVETAYGFCVSFLRRLLDKVPDKVGEHDLSAYKRAAANEAYAMLPPPKKEGIMEEVVDGA